MIKKDLFYFKKKMANQKKRWAITIWIPKEETDFQRYKEILDEHLKHGTQRWVYQVEKAESGQLHFQGRVSWKQPKRESELKIALGLPCHGTIEGKEEESEFYCMKDDTRIAGPWSNKDKEIYIPRQIKEIEGLYPWQEKIIELSKVWDTRTIHCIIDTGGCTGKSILVSYMSVHGIAKRLPFCNDYKDLLRMCYDVGPQKAYTIDMPRAICKDRLNQLYSSIETIKDGYCYDDRYTFRERDFDCPNIFIFTNRPPDMHMLSRDRWALWTVKDQKLLPYVPIVSAGAAL